MKTPKTILAVVAAVAVTGGVLGTSMLKAEDKPTTKPSAGTPTSQPVAAGNTKCPVSGDAIDPAVTTTYNGKTYTFCCADCVKSFNKDPAKYAAAAK